MTITRTPARWSGSIASLRALEFLTATLFSFVMRMQTFWTPGRAPGNNQQKQGLNSGHLSVETTQ